jgi:DNA-directed RNA polymerase subunit N (RpoN/RPB10)
MGASRRRTVKERMIIPVVCMNCGFPLADKWRFYQKTVAEIRRQKNLPAEPIVIDGSSIPDTPEKRACDAIGITRYCCRKVMLTHRDIIDKI